MCRGELLPKLGWPESSQKLSFRLRAFLQFIWLLNKQAIWTARNEFKWEMYAESQFVYTPKFNERPSKWCFERLEIIYFTYSLEHVHILVSLYNKKKIYCKSLDLWYIVSKLLAQIQREGFSGSVWTARINFRGVHEFQNTVHPEFVPRSWTKKSFFI